MREGRSATLRPFRPSEAGDRTIEFDLSEAELERLEDGLTDGYRSTLLDSIAAIESPDGIVAVAAMDEYGVLTRTADGTWRYAAVGDSALSGDVESVEYVETDDDDLAEVLIAIGALSSLVLLGGSAIPVGFRARRARRSVPGYVLGTLAGVVVATLVSVVFLAVEALSSDPGATLVVWISGHRPRDRLWRTDALAFRSTQG